MSSCAPKLILEKSSFAKMDGWYGDHTASLIAFEKSCKKITSLPEDFDMGIAGTPMDWLEPCYAASTYLNSTKAGDLRAKQFFEKYFIPFKAHNNFSSEGLFTGYYEPLLKGSLKKSAKYKYPVYKRPAELVNGTPFLSRKEIEEGALDNRGLELVYVDNPVDLFFLHVQGSGRIYLDDGKQFKLGFDGKNNLPYSSIGKILIESSEIAKEDMSADTIKLWLHENPKSATEIMQSNESFIFFKELKDTGPVGAQGVELTPESSLAVDKRFIPYGIPVWLDTTLPDTGEGEVAFKKLLIAQDTGSAIRGPVRGDIFFGHGKRAEELAHNMQQTGEYYLLIPKSLAGKVNDGR
jgi:membrane-bound lytic murein transglycosylase A